MITIPCVLFSSCVTCCPPENKDAPPVSEFREISISVPSGEPCPTWHTPQRGKPVVLLHALNGISPKTLEFAQEMARWGYRVYLPSLYGDCIEGQSPFGWDEALEAAKFLPDDPRWNIYGENEGPGPVLDDVREVVRFVSRREGGRQVVVIGNCLTGSFPLALLDEPAVDLAVLAQPAMPLLRDGQVIFRIPQRRIIAASTGLSDEQWHRTIAALKTNPDKRIIGFHYRNDPLAPIWKFDTIHETLRNAGISERFTAYVLAPGGMMYSRKRPDWVIGGVTKQQRTMITPHSTIINPVTKTDRDWFRKHLRKELAR
ncbi:MAG: dienelactone hydrolase family protein [Verrucomicrobiales bacterium]|nr:dienelactone hydrolase family protein [Verrucomicrobiales bacterium]